MQSYFDTMEQDQVPTKYSRITLKLAITSVRVEEKLHPKMEDRRPTPSLLFQLSVSWNHKES
jgi:hypothetical protein